ncbi:hypothetical protein M514_03550 [Trichuris suis]|uniref:Abnormal cell migration protein 18-like fibronectin type I domain-containing protein n=1 Tax=Trichuris suis TaxID=68888 RepID=A0A085ME52_9BILA|nr:hypothetical protein M513_03550 [Trichuris suis]KFD71300.1 hypothetical protein M514_03550 [Trichuris suis]KHJ48334.1 hypothetical protein D918_01605 [Trichuris suis]
MQWSSALLLAIGCLQATIILCDQSKVCVKSSSSYYYSYSKIEIERVFWKYEKKVRTVAIGCTLDSGESILFGQTYQSTYFVLRCEKVNDTAVKLVPVKCILDGKPVEKGESRPKGFFVYTCRQQTGAIGLEITGCIGDGHAVAAIGETFTRRSFTFICMKQGTTVVQKAVGCIINGQQVPVHQIISFDKFWYKCSRYGKGGIKAEVMGCVTSKGERVDAGERYRDEDVLLYCKETAEGVSIVFAGCVAKELGVVREFAFGDTWYTLPIHSLSYKLKCTGNERSVRAEIIECVANLDQGRRTLAVGQCAKYGDDRMFSCQRDASGKVVARLVTVQEYYRLQRTFTAVQSSSCRIVK